MPDAHRRGRTVAPRLHDARRDGEGSDDSAVLEDGENLLFFAKQRCASMPMQPHAVDTGAHSSLGPPTAGCLRRRCRSESHRPMSTTLMPLSCANFLTAPKQQHFAAKFLRFAVGEVVLCSLTREEAYKEGTIIKQFWRSSEWPRGYFAAVSSDALEPVPPAARCDAEPERRHLTTACLAHL